MPQFCGNVYRGVGNTNVWGSITGQPGLACVYVTEVLKHYRVTGDRKFLDAFWPGVKKAVAWERAAKKPPFETLIAEMDGAAAAMARIENEPELAHELETEAAQQHLSVYMIPTPHSRMWPEGIHRTYERIYRYNKSAWGLASTGNAKFAKPPVSNESDMYTLGECMLLLEVTGAYLDAPGGRLMVSPQLLPVMTELHAPVFFARFWGWLDCNAQEFRLKIVRHFGEPLELRELAADAKAAPIRLPEPFVAREGAVLDLSPWRRELWMTVPEPPLAAHEELRWSRTGIGTLLWNATASSDEPFPPSDAFDGYPETRWETPAQGRMSDWFQLDLGKVTPLERIEAMTTPNAKLRVEFSSDGQRWQTLPTPTTASTSGVWGLDWFSGPVRFLKMVPARDMNQSWVIREISAK